MKNKEWEKGVLEDNSYLFMLTDITEVKDELENLKDLKLIHNYRVEAVGGETVDEYIVYIYFQPIQPNECELASLDYIYEVYTIND